MKLIDKEELKERLLYKRIVKFEEDKLYLDDGTIVSIEETDSDCCASAFGEFKKVELEALITDVKVGEYKDNGEDADEEYSNKNTVTIYSNQNPVAQAECYADAGNGGYYFSICSLVIGDVYFPVVKA
nr:MAG TPA: hypothetical protein [Caudoviricetes sp.]